MTDDAPHQKNTQELEPYVGWAGKLTLPQTLMFLKSVIQRGEPWTEECEQAYDAAHDHLNDLAAMMNRLLQENRALRSIASHKHRPQRRSQGRLTNLLIGCLAILIAALAVVLVANGNGMLILVLASFVLFGLLLRVISDRGRPNNG
jgi:Flp pilus assembly protein TadB